MNSVAQTDPTVQTAQTTPASQASLATQVRVRYAPSPTGLQHIGGVRTALFNYLFAHNQKACGRPASFILRIEDTDSARSQQHYIQDLYDSLEWLGIQPDEGPATAGFPGGDYGPYIQSERLELYQKYTQQLLNQGSAYYCFCSPERLDQLRAQQADSKSPLQGYDRHCRNILPEEAAQRHSAGENCVVRFAIPFEGSTVFHDLLLGDIERANSDINPDPIILKADGFPTYHLANVIDDHLMNISHILRAQEWLSSGPLHMLLYQAFGWQPPQFCHLPMVMGQDQAGKLSKLSKRHGSTSLIEFRKAGYLREAIINYIALLGWAFDDSREFFSLAELEQCFDLAKLSRSPAIFDYHKLEWFNGQYIRQWTTAELQAQLKLPLHGAVQGKESCGQVPDFSLWQQRLPAVYCPLPQHFEQSLTWILPLLQERLKFLSDAPSMAAYFFARPSYDEPSLAIPKKHDAAQAIELLQKSHSVLRQLCCQDWEWQDFGELMATKPNWESAFRSAAEEAGVKLGPLMQPLRYAISGTNASPPLIESMMILQRLAGAQELLQRIDQLSLLLQKT